MKLLLLLLLLLLLWLSSLSQEFFRCDYFIDAGAAGLLVKLKAAVDRGLAAVDFGGCMNPQVWS